MFKIWSNVLVLGIIDKFKPVELKLKMDDKSLEMQTHFPQSLVLPRPKKSGNGDLVRGRWKVEMMKDCAQSKFNTDTSGAGVH